MTHYIKYISIALMSMMLIVQCGILFVILYLLGYQTLGSEEMYAELLRRDAFDIHAFNSVLTENGYNLQLQGGLLPGGEPKDDYIQLAAIMSGNEDDDGGFLFYLFVAFVAINVAEVCIGIIYMMFYSEKQIQ